MESILNTIQKHNLINKKDIVGVACSGGRDSMCLLHYLNSIKERFDFEVVAINIDHDIRANSASDSLFVAKYCEKHNIKIHMFKVNAKKLTADQGLTLEQGARMARYKVFQMLLDKGTVSKIALGHHMQDQAETILLNIFRGAGLNGASGMDCIRDKYIRPLLYTNRNEIMAYVVSNDIPYVDDETNNDNSYSRNYIRNMIMPMLRNKWNNVDSNLCKFSEKCKEDDSYINSTLPKDLIIDKDLCKISLDHFNLPNPVINRLLMTAIKKVGIYSDIEKKHLHIIKSFAKESENGNKITLPNNLVAIKEYDYIVLTNKIQTSNISTFAFEKGKTTLPGLGVIEVSITRKFELNKYSHLIDCAKLPKDAVWRFKKNGDIFEKFGGGTKSLGDYLTDKKVPIRLRNSIPLLVVGNQVLIIGGIEISEKLKIDKTTKSAYGINVILF